ncbi:hypothetical protein CP965_02435 [Halarcobacter mediterraneus]|uniref:AB hydrolase-1 domain-containing protein n=1 Tax=Halarcobacter mediterraneus TaxID=2023153 RepID=A0A4Q1AY94_9BACT|nr:alpha/beta fold hydrolase [Halarcobacter mediterraneus]RXK14323.1 hypothetical protein CP965_02435 [Halarcobacter mediterraneus]
MKTKLFLIPGLMCDNNLWSKLNIHKEFDLVYLELPSKNSINEIVSSFHKLLKNEEKVNILGFSLGGYLGLYYLCKYPHKIEKAYIISSGINSLVEEEIKNRKNLIKLIDNNNITSISTKSINKLLENKNDLQNIEIIQEMFINLGIKTYKNQLISTLYRKDLYPTLSKTKTPIKFLYSENDYLFNKNQLKKLILENHNIEEKVLNSNSHMLPLEYNELLSNEIKKFFKK